MAAYAYQELCDPRSYIGILTLEKGEFNDPLRGSLYLSRGLPINPCMKQYRTTGALRKSLTQFSYAMSPHTYLWQSPKISPWRSADCGFLPGIGDYGPTPFASIKTTTTKSPTKFAR